MDNYAPRYVGITEEQEIIATGHDQDKLYRIERVEAVLPASYKFLRECDMGDVSWEAREVGGTLIACLEDE